MSFRARRTWGVLEAEIRRLLRETDAAASYWSSDDLLDIANRSLDLRALEMDEHHEGWFRQSVTTDLVAGQREYTLPEGITRVRRVSLRYTDGTRVIEVPLYRDSKVDRVTVSTSGNYNGIWTARPTVRLHGSLMFIEPAPSVSREDGLQIEVDALPPRLVDSNSKVDRAFPDALESLLVYDVWDEALGMENAQGPMNEQIVGRLRKRHMTYERAWERAIAVRLQSRVFGRAYSTGD